MNLLLQGGGARDDRRPAGSRQQAADQHAVRLQAQPGARGFQFGVQARVRAQAGFTPVYKSDA